MFKLHNETLFIDRERFFFELRVTSIRERERAPEKSLFV